MSVVRTADVDWVGGFTDGEGTIVATRSGALVGLEVSWPSRVDQIDTGTSPEELLAAAHASCFAMQLTHGLVGAGAEPQQLQVHAEVGFEPGRGITHVALTARMEVTGLSDDKLREVAERAKLGCPVSRALAGVDITLDLPDLAPPPLDEDDEQAAEEEALPAGSE
jgi:osmotically inducible protein OsmC